MNIKQQIINDSLITLKNSLTSLMCTYAYTDRYMFSNALYEWKKYIYNDYGTIIHSDLSNTIHELYSLKDVKSLYDLVSKYEYASKTKQISFSGISISDIRKYHEKAINFATKIYQSIG